MKKQLIKIDRWILNTLTQYVRKWIKKNDFKKHKIDFMLKVELIQIGVVIIFAALLPATWYLIAGQKFSAIAHLTLWLLFTLFYLKGMNLTLSLKKWHDYIFALRKNPEIYEMEKQATEHYFIESRRRRMEGFAMTIGLTIFISMMLLFLDLVLHQISANTLMVAYFLISNFLSILNRYILLVFDFDEPEEKKKVAKESITEVMLKAWQNLIGGLNPIPQI